MELNYWIICQILMPLSAELKKRLLRIGGQILVNYPSVNGVGFLKTPDYCQDIKRL